MYPQCCFDLFTLLLCFIDFPLGFGLTQLSYLILFYSFFQFSKTLHLNNLSRSTICSFLAKNSKSKEFDFQLIIINFNHRFPRLSLKLFPYQNKNSPKKLINFNLVFMHNSKTQNSPTYFNKSIFTPLIINFLSNFSFNTQNNFPQKKTKTKLQTCILKSLRSIQLTKMSIKKSL